MIGEIIKIDAPKIDSDGGSYYRRVYLKLDDGSWAKTDIVAGFRNEGRWDRVMRVGNKLFDLQKKDEDTIDADSWVKLLEGKMVVRLAEKPLSADEKMEQEGKRGLFG